MKFLLTQDHMGLEISKRYSSYSFHLMSAKFYKDIGLPWELQAITYCQSVLSFKIFLALWNFNMLVNGKS